MFAKEEGDKGETNGWGCKLFLRLGTHLVTFFALIESKANNRSPDPPFSDLSTKKATGAPRVGYLSLEIRRSTSWT